MHWTCCSCGIAVHADDVQTLLTARWRTVDQTSTADGVAVAAMLCPVCGQPPASLKEEESEQSRARPESA